MNPGDQVIGVFLVGCRVGSCLMLMPGFSSARVPARIRLFLAITLAFVISPMVLDATSLSGFSGGPQLAKVIASEIVIGAIFGFASRIYLAGLGFAASSMSNYIGLTGMQQDVETDEAAPVVASIVTALATLMLLMMDLHQLILEAVVESYVRLPLTSAADPAATVRVLTGALQAAFLIGLQIVGPFVVYGILVNLMFGVLGKLVPQVPSYFISVPFLIAGGLLLLYFALPEMMRISTREIIEALLEFRKAAP